MGAEQQNFGSRFGKITKTNVHVTRTVKLEKSVFTVKCPRWKDCGKSNGENPGLKMEKSRNLSVNNMP
jgi:hypothetical protein